MVMSLLEECTVASVVGKRRHHHYPGLLLLGHFTEPQLQRNEHCEGFKSRYDERWFLPLGVHPRPLFFDEFLERTTWKWTRRFSHLEPLLETSHQCPSWYCWPEHQHAVRAWMRGAQLHSGSVWLSRLDLPDISGRNERSRGSFELNSEGAVTCTGTVVRGRGARVQERRRRT